MAIFFMALTAAIAVRGSSGAAQSHTADASTAGPLFALPSTPPAIDALKRADTHAQRALRRRVVEIDRVALWPGPPGPPDEARSIPDEFILNLFDDVVIIARKRKIERRSKTAYSWFGRVPGVENSQVILVVDGDQITGNIRLDGDLYHIRPLNRRQLVIFEADRTAWPLDHPPDEFETAPESGTPAPDGADSSSLSSTNSVAAASTSTEITVLVLYTNLAKSASANITAEIQLAVDEMNQSFQNSGINPHISLAAAVNTDYVDSGNSGIDLSRLSDPSDGFIDEAHSLRDQYAADLVSLWVENGDFGGRANLLLTLAGDPDAAFSVVRRARASRSNIFAHELGHNLAAHHDHYVASGSLFPYGYGYVNVADAWRTIMAYNNECSDNGTYCDWLPYWSNPDVTYGGDPMGIAEGQANAADNRKTLNNTALVVSRYRSLDRDNYEVNNTLATAYDLSSYEKVWLRNIDGYGIQASDDWYKIHVTPGHERVLIDLRFSHAEGNIDIRLTDPYGGVWATSNSVTNNETIDVLVNDKGGDYYIQVYNDDAGNRYDLLWDDVPPYSLTVSRNGNGSVTSKPSGINCGPDCQEPYVWGTVVDLTATPAPHHRLESWGGACSGDDRCRVTMYSAADVTATFVRTPDIVPALQLLLFD